MREMGKYARYALTALELLLLVGMWIALIANFSRGLFRDEIIVIGMGSFLSFEMAVLTGVIVSKIKGTREIGAYIVTGLEAVLLHGLWVAFLSRQGTAAPVATESFLALEMVVFTVVMVSMLKKK